MEGVKLLLVYSSIGRAKTVEQCKGIESRKWRCWRINEGGIRESWRADVNVRFEMNYAELDVVKLLLCS